ncbi:hypothetical protein, partial [Brevundimonas denitrificans]|uniref:hypothetical protein n=1 Tax=Brevundimonas denitrificans TaxID=1443434 RepID=UPI00223BC2CA
MQQGCNVPTQGGGLRLTGGGGQMGGQAHQIVRGVRFGRGRRGRFGFGRAGLGIGKTVQWPCNVFFPGGAFGRLAGLDLGEGHEGLELLVETQPAAGLDQLPGGHGGLDVGPACVDHLRGGEGRPRWRLRRFGDDKGSSCAGAPGRARG